MDLGQIGITIFSTLTGSGALVAGLGYAYSQYTVGAGKAKDELLETYKETLTAKELVIGRLQDEKNTLISSHQQQLNSLNQQMGILKGTLESNEKSLKEYKEVFQGRNPEQVQFMQFMIENSKQTAQVLAEIKTYVAGLNSAPIKLKRK